MTSQSSIIASHNTENVSVAFRDRLTGSSHFKTLFDEGMALVDETATYLDGQGRLEARALKPPVSLAYATESMRLTTRLMQLASWLLLRRAVANGEMTAEQAQDDRHRVYLMPLSRVGRARGYDELPARLRGLIEASYRLHERIYRLDLMIRGDDLGRQAPQTHPLGAQLEQIRAAFAPGVRYASD